MKKKKKGNALIIAVLLSAIVGGAAIGVAAVASRQLRISETYNKGILAFYAAESGLEQGLLYYKYNPDQEIPETINLDSSDPVERKPINAFRYFIERPMMRLGTGNQGYRIGYVGNLREQVYDLQVYYKQKFYGDDMDNSGSFNAADLKLNEYKNASFRILKDDSHTFQILPDNNNIYLLWKWTENCNAKARGLEIKIKVKETNPISGKNEYTTIIRDARCNRPIAGSTIDAQSELGINNVFSPGGELKAKMGISALTATEMTIKPVGNTTASNDMIYFGFNQVANGTTQPSIRTAGPTTTVKSVGYYAGTTRQITANINRQNGSIIDLFQYVIYQGAQNGT